MAGFKGVQLAKQAEKERRLAAEKKADAQPKEEAQVEAPKVEEIKAPKVEKADEEKAESDEPEIKVAPATTAEAKLIAAEQAEEEQRLAAEKKADEEKADIAAINAAIEKKLGKHPEFFLTNSQGALELTSEQCKKFRDGLVAEDMKAKTGAGGRALNELIGWFDRRIGAPVAEEDGAERHEREHARTHLSPANGVPAVIVNGSAPAEARSDAPARADEPTDKVNVPPVNVKTGAEGKPASSGRGRKDVRGLSGSLEMKLSHPVSRREMVGCALIFLLCAGLLGTNVGHWYLDSAATGASRPIARTEEREQPHPSREAMSVSQPTVPAAPRPATTPTISAPVCHPASEMGVCGGTRQLTPGGHWHCGAGSRPIFVGGQLDHCESACEYCS